MNNINAAIVILLMLSALFLSSCFENEVPVKPFPRGDVKVTVIPMTPDYTNQFYYSFEKNQIVKENRYDIWDLAFQCYGEDFYILLNGAKFMEAADMGQIDFESVKDRNNSNFKYDSTNGGFDDYAIGKWWTASGDSAISKNHVYIVNRGRDNNSKKMGYVKMQIISADKLFFTVRFADLDGKNDNTVNIPRKSDINYMMFSFDDIGIILELEPPNSEWDIEFTRMIGFLPFENSLLPYGVTGIMINHTSTEVYKDSVVKFADIQLSDVENYIFSQNPGYIGHDWKNFELNGEVYTPKIYMNYVLKDTYGFYWKFRFVDFYNEEGQRGYPKFEFKKL